MFVAVLILDILGGNRMTWHISIAIRSMEKAMHDIPFPHRKNSQWESSL